MTCPVPCDRMPVGRRFRPHCHVEGCDWPQDCPRDTDGDGDCWAGATCTVAHRGCGLYRIAPDTSLGSAVDLGCAAMQQVLEATT